MKKYFGIQILRFIAASLVVVEHASNNVMRHWKQAAVMPPYGEVGVYLFFGISGFIMLNTQYENYAAQNSAQQARQFFMRRLLRVLPIYLLATSLQLINKWHYSADYNLINYCKSLFFIPYIGDSGNFRPVLGQGWTLNYEMFFYLLFAISLLFSRLRGLLLCMLVLVGLSLLQGQAQTWPPVFAFYVNRILLFFLVGMLVALLLKLRESWQLGWPIMWGGGLIIGGLLIGYISPPAMVFAYYLLMVFACVMLAATLHQENLHWLARLLTQLGDASYSTYLFHGFLLGGLKFISSRIPTQQYGWLLLFLLVCVVLANGLGMLAYRWVEQPIARRLKGIV